LKEVQKTVGIWEKRGAAVEEKSSSSAGERRTCKAMKGAGTLNWGEKGEKNQGLCVETGKVGERAGEISIEKKKRKKGLFWAGPRKMGRTPRSVFLNPRGVEGRELNPEIGRAAPNEPRVKKY